MKALLLFLLMVGNSWALPVFNLNVAQTGRAGIIWPDHQNPLMFYVLPKGLKTVDRYQWGYSLIGNVLKVGFTNEFDEEMVKFTESELTRKYPGRKFEIVHVSPVNTKIEIGEVLSDFTISYQCRNNSEPEAAYQFYCIFDLSSIGLEQLVPFLERRRSLALSSVFEVKGYIQKVDGSLEVRQIEIGLPTRMEVPDHREI